MSGKWIEEPPTEPGWYKAVYYDDDFERRPEVYIVYVNSRLMVRGIIDGYDYLPVSDIRYTHWWSYPETLPPLPSENA